LTAPEFSRTTWEDDVRQFLYARLDSEWRSGKWSNTDLIRFLTCLAKSPETITHLAVMYHLFRSDGAEPFLVTEIPHEVRTLSHDTRRERAIRRHIGRGHVRWPQTLRCQANYSDPTVHVVREVIKEYDTPPNRLVSHYLKEIWAAIQSSVPASGSKLAVRAAAVSQSVTESLRSVYLRQARSVPAVTSQMLLAAERSRRRLYSNTGALWREYERLLDPNDVTTLANVLSTGWLAPLSDDDLYEIYVLVRVLRALEARLAGNDPARIDYRLIGAGGTGALATFRSPEWIGHAFFDMAPHNTFNEIFSDSDYRYTSLLYEYGTASMSARRPDICIKLRRKSDGFTVPLIVEVKNTSLADQYGRDSIYKVLGYLSDCAKLWSAERRSIRPKAALVLRDGVAPKDYDSSLAREIVLFCPPDLTKKFDDLIASSLASVGSSPPHLT